MGEVLFKEGDFVIPDNPGKDRVFLKKCEVNHKIPKENFIGKKCRVIIISKEKIARILNEEGESCWWTIRHLRKAA